MDRYYPLLATLRPLFPFRDEVLPQLLIPEAKRLWKQVLRSQHWAPLVAALHSDSWQRMASSHRDVGGDAIKASLPPSADREALERACRLLVPWRIGPFQLGELVIDSEWQSNLKWSRLQPLLPPLRGLRVADVGCSNGYFLLKMAACAPEIAIGLDPIDRCWLQFAVLQSVLRLPHCGFLPAGMESLEGFPSFFDLIVCMGVLYHQRDPRSAVKQLFRSLRPGGTAILESLVIDRPGEPELLPKGRYAKMRNAWVIPSPGAMALYLEEAGFHNIAVHNFGAVTTAEQRRTEWAPYESLAEFLNPNDRSLTIEGHPAPHSAIVTGLRPL